MYMYYVHMMLLSKYLHKGTFPAFAACAKYAKIAIVKASFLLIPILMMYSISDSIFICKVDLFCWGLKKYECSFWFIKRRLYWAKRHVRVIFFQHKWLVFDHFWVFLRLASRPRDVRIKYWRRRVFPVCMTSQSLINYHVLHTYVCLYDVTSHNKLLTF